MHTYRFWFPFARSSDIRGKGPWAIRFMKNDLVAYRPESNKSLIVHTDRCPHQGARLSAGWVNTNGNLQCPYHGFEFCSGTFCRIPDPTKNPPYFVSKVNLPTTDTIEIDDMCFIGYDGVASNDKTVSDIPVFFPPEHYNESFRAIHGSRRIKTSSVILIENLLDMLHISYVHSFGNSMVPLPTNLTYKDVGKTSGRTTFFYQPDDFTISNQVGNSSRVIVENEFHLPSNTITRVSAGNVIKTVFTRVMPVDDNECILYWSVYRNFWIDPYAYAFSRIGDWLLRILMEITINEDQKILSVVPFMRSQMNITTKYDVTIRNFRAQALLHIPVLYSHEKK